MIAEESEPVPASFPGLPEAALVFLAAMDRRFACKRFLPGRRLPPSFRDYIMECGRLSPSSFGLEHWKFLGIETPGAASPWVKACFGQEAIATASLLAAILVRAGKDYEPDSAFVISRAERFPGGYPVFLPDYEGYHRFLAGNRRVEAWARSQSYIAAANMMTGAACAGIDSCAIEGYSEDSVLGLLGLSSFEWSVGLIVAFGFRDEALRPKIREKFEDIVEIEKEK